LFPDTGTTVLYIDIPYEPNEGWRVAQDRYVSQRYPANALFLDKRIVPTTIPSIIPQISEILVTVSVTPSPATNTFQLSRMTPALKVFKIDPLFAESSFYVATLRLLDRLGASSSDGFVSMPCADLVGRQEI
jgi:hypothetical protein